STPRWGFGAAFIAPTNPHAVVHSRGKRASSGDRDWKPARMHVDVTLGARQHQQLRGMLMAQHGVVSHQQALSLGITPSSIRAQVAAGVWSVLSPGAYFAANGSPGQASRLWAALLACGGEGVPY
ncbi:MAG: type IV toxin-antitoxin system AbiEi family antitoxin domain-containing protein, partial [Actinomycetia bacterium]|nr:type IV toxin-antitoxin system AbiEi family antitoxin domain-containing protein [Actinomycetes bacterium]